MNAAWERVIRFLEFRFRRLPLPVKAAAKRVLEALDPLIVAVHRRRTGYRLPIPPLRLRVRVGTPMLKHFTADVRPTLDAFDRALGRIDRSVSDFTSIVDFGCGSGRVLSGLYDLAKPGGPLEGVTLAGSDIDHEAIEWLRETHPGLDVSVNPFLPPVPQWAEDRFDLFYSISIFTHLDEPAMRAWLGEIDRVLAPGGVALLTVLSPRYYELFRSGEVVTNSNSCARRMAARGTLSHEGFVFEPYERTTWNEEQFVGVDGTYGITFHSPDYVRTEWSKYLDIHDRVDTPEFAGQDIIVATKRRAEAKAQPAASASTEGSS